MRYIAQVRDDQGMWRSIRPAGKKPYKFDTREIAEKFLHDFYPEHRGSDKLRVSQEDE